MKIYCINLKQSVSRREKMERELEKLEFQSEFIDAVDGRVLSRSERELVCSDWRTRMRHGRRLTGGELGCVLSHLVFYRRLLDSCDRVAVVLEDDVELMQDFNDAARDVEKFLSEIEEPAIVQFPGLERDFSAVRDRAFVQVRSALGTYAYAVNRAGAELLLKRFSPIRMPIDKYDYLIRHCGLSYYVYSSRVLSVDNEGESMVGSERFDCGDMSGLRWAIHKLWRCIGVIVDSILRWCGK